MKLNFSKLSMGAFLCFALASCKKNDAVNTPASSQQASLARVTNTIGALADESDLDMQGIALDKVSEDCPVITYNPSEDVYPHTKIVDYGSGCISNGITRSGRRIYTEYADKKTAPAGKVVSVLIYDNYVVNDISISGSVKTSVVSSGSDGPLVLRIVASKAITDNAGNTSSYVNVQVQKQVEGDNTNDGSDDVYEITDNAHGTQITDNVMYTFTYSADPSNIVIKPNSCTNRTQGALKITLKNNGAITNEYLDYGNGDCDKTAALSVNGGTPETVSLPFYFFATE